MRIATIAVLSLALLATSPARADGPILVVTDAGETAARVGAPVSVRLDRATALDGTAKPGRLQLVELIGESDRSGPAVPAQFVPDSEGSRKGRLWWLMRPGPKGRRRFKLVVSPQPQTTQLQPGVPLQDRCGDWVGQALAEARPLDPFRSGHGDDHRRR